MWVPVLLGLGIVAYLFFSDPNITIDELRLVADARWWPIFLAVLVFFSRFAGYVYRIKVVTEDRLSWVSSIYVIMLWEFASAVTPSVVGGTAVAVFILWKEGLNFGRSLGYVLLTAIFDNLFFVVSAPIFLFIGYNNIFPASMMTSNLLEDGIDFIFFLSYTLIAVYTFVMLFAVFINPRLIKWVLVKATSNRLLRRWRFQAYERGNEMLIASAQLKDKAWSYWIKIALSTIFVWSSRYLMLNCIMMAFTRIDLQEHLLIFGKQIILWVIMLISPTPGSSGTAEYFFPIFFKYILGDYTFISNVLWRIFTYYPYLLLGAIFLPKWVKRVFLKKKASV